MQHRRLVEEFGRIGTATIGGPRSPGSADFRRGRPVGASVALPVESGRGMHVYHQFTIRAERRDAIREALAKDGIASSVFYPMPLHQQPAYASLAKGVSLPVAEKVAKTVLSLPIHPLLDEASVDCIAACVRKAA